jgi:hypothetical protein
VQAESAQVYGQSPQGSGRSGGKLALTAKGRGLLADPGRLWRTVAAGLLGDNGFEVFAGELFLALLVDASSVPDREIRVTVGQAVAEEGFRQSRTGEPPDDHDISRAIHATSNLCRALGLLAVGGDWRDRSSRAHRYRQVHRPRGPASEGHRPAYRPVAMTTACAASQVARRPPALVKPGTAVRALRC